MPLSSGMSIHDDTKHKGSAKRDTVNGVVGLNVNGDILVLGERLYMTRNVSDDVHLLERTSSEHIQRWTRIASNDYRGDMLSGGSFSTVQLANMKGVANGIAGLDANGLLCQGIHNPFKESYQNHLGVIDNFLTTAVNGSATVTEDVTNHEIDIAVPDNDTRACLKSKSSYLTDTKPLILSFKFNNIVVGGESKGMVGIHDSISDSWPTDGCYFRIWYSVGDTETYLTPHCSSGGTRSDGSNFIPVSGDIITIIATSSKVMFFQNGVLKDTIVSNIPSNAQPMAFSLFNSFSACSYSIDALSLEKYV